MGEYLQVSIIVPPPKEGMKPRWLKVGAAFPNKLGGYSLKLDCPITIVPGMTDIVLAPPFDKNKTQPQERTVNEDVNW